MDRTLREGMTGTDVRTAQACLNYHIGPQILLPIKEDGVFGGATRDRTMEFQRLAKLDVDGIIGPLTRASLLSFQKTEIKGTLTPRASSRPAQNLQLPPKLRELPDVHSKPVTPYLKVPDWFWPNRSDTGIQIKKWEFQGGQEFDIPWSDSSPAQISVEATVLRKLNGEEQEGTLGAQWSYTPRSDDGKWNAQFYVKKSWDNLLPNAGPISLLNPWVYTYVKIPSKASSVIGLGAGNESSVDLIKNDDGKTVLSLVFGPAITVDFIDLDGPRLIGRPNGQFTIGIKGAIETGSGWKGAPPGHTPLDGEKR
jgi:Putative peptidoglycan binding domain